MAMILWAVGETGCTGLVTPPEGDLQLGELAQAPPWPMDAPQRGQATFQAEETVRPDLPPPAAPLSPSCDLAVTQVAAYQAVKCTLWRAGEIVQGPRLVVGKPTLFRVFVEPGVRWPNRLARARLTLTEPGGSIRTYEVERLMAGMSRDADGASTFNFVINGVELTAETRYRVELDLGPECRHVEGSRKVPREGPLPLGAVDVAPLRISLVPIVYDADGSGRRPHLSHTHLDELRSAISAMWPARELELSVRASISTNVPLDDESFPLLLERVRAVRLADQPASDVHYMGLVAPTPELSEHCRGTCTAGLAFGNVMDDASLRVGVALGYAGEDAVRAFVHELGHTLGLRHAPCNTSLQLDPQYPHEGGLLGVWGFDERTRSFRDPERVGDFMGYCPEPWISDYSYGRIQTRLRSFLAPPAALRAGAFTQEPFVGVLVTEAGSVRPGMQYGPGLPLLEEGLVAHLNGAEAVLVHRLPVEDVHARLWLLPARVVQQPGKLRLPDGQSISLPLAGFRHTP